MTPDERAHLEAMANDWHKEADALRRAENRDTDRATTLHFCADALEMTLRLLPNLPDAPQATQAPPPLPAIDEPPIVGHTTPRPNHAADKPKRRRR